MAQEIGNQNEVLSRFSEQMYELSKKIKYHNYGFAKSKTTNKSKFAFVHIPKSGGTTIDTALAWGLAAHGISFDGMFLKRGGSEELYRERDETIWPISSKFDVEKINSSNFVFVSQHFLNEDVALIDDEYFRFSLVRDPYQRYISHCLFLAKRVFRGGIDPAKFLSLCDMVLAEHSNTFCNRLLGRTEQGEDGASLLARLDASYDAVVPIERADRVVSAILGRYGEFAVSVPAQNSQLTPPAIKQQAVSMIDKHLKSKFVDHNQSDLSLVRAVEAREAAAEEGETVDVMANGLILPPVRTGAAKYDLTIEGFTVSIGPTLMGTAVRRDGPTLENFVDMSRAAKWVEN